MSHLGLTKLLFPTIPSFPIHPFTQWVLMLPWDGLAVPPCRLRMCPTLLPGTGLASGPQWTRHTPCPSRSFKSDHVLQPGLFSWHHWGSLLTMGPRMRRHLAQRHSSRLAATKCDVSRKEMLVFKPLRFEFFVTTVQSCKI